ncbi:3-oxoacyl-ACP synthase [Nitrococcus mobilis]|uniref:3-oxoacyl-(Acyl carrier protein) synthase n=1 Tax=Nitrococcus mobilis Nb-231 TaxID=314278 RepID=A4BPI4_9GAMM|nr:3-oxoacyl-ACP synthase [Nitrococcus mobilis]EAR22485.1 3-oxoacyl-(acyl carrier protein) synthase [Nitrococcus mobilis Nb-231]
MSVPPLAILTTGMVTGVGLSAPASCAAIRCAIDNFQETRFMDSGGEWILGCEIPLEQPWRGRTKLVKMLSLALQECLDSVPRLLDPASIPLILGVAESMRPGRIEGLDDALLLEVEAELGVRFHQSSAVIAGGRVSAVHGLKRARELLTARESDKVIVAGVDGLLTAPALAVLEARDRLLTSQNSDGFIPGEAAAAAVVELARPSQDPQLLCVGLGFGNEPASVEAEDQPLRADGLVQAIRGALAEVGTTLAATDFRITDVSGEQYGFKEAALSLSRILRERKEEYDLWHPADCIGEVGAAIGPAILGVTHTATAKAYAPGNNVLTHFGNDDGRRAAAILTYQPVKAA